MRINKFLFPALLLFIFFGVIALGMVAGYWEPKGGGRHQHESALPYQAVTQALDASIRSEWPWQS